MVQPLDTKSDAFHIALSLAISAATEKYPREVARINKGAILITMGHVDLEDHGYSARIRSASHADVLYTVNGTCQCTAFRFLADGHCSHRWAKSLLNKALGSLEHMWYAVYHCPGTVFHGIVVEGEDAYTFHCDNGKSCSLQLNSPWLVRLGRCDMVSTSNHKLQ